MTIRPTVTRRGLLGASVAGGVLASTPGSNATAVTLSKRRHDVDVVIVGAGLAGLSAATELHRRGHSVVVLEARDRVGGRNLDLDIGQGKVVEMGGEWTGPGQDRVQALAKRLGIKTFETYATGDSIYYANGKATRYTGDIPPADPAALAELEVAIVSLNNMASTVSARRPWQASQAGAYDIQTIEQWGYAQCHTPEARQLLNVAIRGVYGEDATQISLLDLLAAIDGVGGDFNTLIGSAQSIRFVGGPQQMSKRLAKHLGSRVKLQHVVTRIDHDHAHVTAHTTHAEFRGRAMVLAVPKPILGTIHFTPELPPAYVQFFQRQPMGATIKINAIYDKPFWRKDGLNGSVVSDTGPIEVVYDNSPPDGSPGVLVGFMEGSEGRANFAKSQAARRHAAIACFVRYFGAAAAKPTTVHEMVWAKERYTQGAYGTFSPPGVLTGLGKYVESSVGRMHFAGADFSPRWAGYMDGAIRSGESAAAAIGRQLR
ncbi:MAG: flavin monoamine oxidase family protein [Frankiaceae bacterium]|nr:flavin monoamine oxidase family protein [Frankiaceae bacterium]